MYKLLLCWRYLRTRYIALASIVSVTLGVATIIVVNSVMQGFSYEMEGRLHGILSDVVFESRSLDGFPDSQWHIAKINSVAGDYIAGMTPTVHVPAMLGFDFRGQHITRQIMLIGIDSKTHASVGDFGQYLQHPANRKQLSFDLREDGYDTFDHQVGPSGIERPEMGSAGWVHRRMWSDFEKRMLRQQQRMEQQPSTGVGAEPAATQSTLPRPEQGAPEGTTAHFGPEGPNSVGTSNSLGEPIDVQDPFAGVMDAPLFDPALEQHPGVVLGIAMVSYRDSEGQERFMSLPGNDVTISYPTVSQPPKILSSNFTVVDFYESKMSEFDSGYAFVPIKTLQELRGMLLPGSDIGQVSSIQIKLKPGVEPAVVRDLLQAEFPGHIYNISTWRDKQGPLLAAVAMETGILNILLFLIIAVAGFGILAIFFMIVVEKTRDIGILKSLGASRRGVMTIFLTYGVLLGIVGSGVGMILGLVFVANINKIADLLGKVTGHDVFDPDIYYFQEIPTIVQPFTVSWIVLGAVLIAVGASILPARRAARLHPVEALRYE